MRTFKTDKMVCAAVRGSIKNTGVDTTEAMRFAYEPGNGTRYEMVIARFDEELFVGIPNFHRSYHFRKGTHPTYVAEKLRLSEGDAEEVTKVINACFSDSP